MVVGSSFFAARIPLGKLADSNVSRETVGEASRWIRRFVVYRPLALEAEWALIRHPGSPREALRGGAQLPDEDDPPVTPGR